MLSKMSCHNLTRSSQIYSNASYVCLVEVLIFEFCLKPHPNQVPNTPGDFPKPSMKITTRTYRELCGLAHTSKTT